MAEAPPAAAPHGASQAASQTLKAQLALRDVLLEGRLLPGERVSELQMVEVLGVSRTPVRSALARLAEEGLLDPIPTGGYAVRSFSEAEVFAAIEIRGTLEGLAARMAAERDRAVPAALRGLAACLDGIDAVLAQDRHGIEEVSRYVELNARFHAGLVALAESRTLAQQLDRVVVLPFASPSALVRMQSSAPEARRSLVVAQDQHRCVLEAVGRGEGARAEAIMREHARLARRNLERAFRDQRMLALVPGSALIRRRVHDHDDTSRPGNRASRTRAGEELTLG